MNLDRATAKLHGLVGDPILGERAGRIEEALKLGPEY